MAAQVSPSLEVSAPEKRFDLAPWVNGASEFEPLPNGSLLITRKAEGEDEVRQFDIVLNFPTELERTLRKAPAGSR